MQKDLKKLSYLKRHTLNSQLGQHCGKSYCSSPDFETELSSAQICLKFESHPKIL
jgi:hypothetical protein